MTLTVVDPTGCFHCKKCEITFNATYKPQQRPRKSCPGCHKMSGLTVIKSLKTKSINKRISPQEGDTSHVPLTIKLSADYLEECLMSALFNQPNNANLIGKAIDFYLKVRVKSDTMEDDIDMEELRRSGIIAEYSN